MKKQSAFSSLGIKALSFWVLVYDRAQKGPMRMCPDYLLQEGETKVGNKRAQRREDKPGGMERRNGGVKGKREEVGMEPSLPTLA